VIIRPAAAADADSIASLLNAFLATTTIEWTDTPQAADNIPEWLDQHETILVAEVARMPQIGAKFGRWLDLVLLQLRLDDRTAPRDD
jgi:L-amino acid N-acyltransferase YncA